MAMWAIDGGVIAANDAHNPTIIVIGTMILGYAWAPMMQSDHMRVVVTIFDIKFVSKREPADASNIMESEPLMNASMCGFIYWRMPTSGDVKNLPSASVVAQRTMDFQDIASLKASSNDILLKAMRRNVATIGGIAILILEMGEEVNIPLENQNSMVIVNKIIENIACGVNSHLWVW